MPDSFQPIQALPGVGDLPLLLVRAGREQADIAETVAAFITAAESYGASFEVIDVVGGQHGFDTLDHNDDSRRAVRQALSWVKALQPEDRRVSGPDDSHPKSATVGVWDKEGSKNGPWFPRW